MSDSRNHKWPGGLIRVPSSQTANGCDQTERTCTLCHLVKITVHPPRGFPWREWRRPDGRQFRVEHRLECVPVMETANP